MKNTVAKKEGENKGRNKRKERKEGRKDRGTEQDTMLSEELKNRDEQYNK